MLGDSKNSAHRESAQRALRFLMSQKQKDVQGNLYWPGEVYFAATFVARYPVVWRSTAYTTAVIAKALVLADQWRL
jgi:hypothetical protein